MRSGRTRSNGSLRTTEKGYEISRRSRVELCAVSPNCDLSSPVPVQREVMISYVRECIKLAHDLGSPICKVFAAWRGITLYDGLATYNDTYSYNQYGFWKGDRRGFVVDAMRELCQVAEDYGILLAMQNHGPDIVNRYQDVLTLIEEVGSPAFKACMDINIEPLADSPENARQMADASGSLGRTRTGAVGAPMAPSWWLGDISTHSFSGRSPIPLTSMRWSHGYSYMNWEFCHPARERKTSRDRIRPPANGDGRTTPPATSRGGAKAELAV